MINPNLDIETLTKKFKTDKRMMVNNFMQQDIADRIRNACMNVVPFVTHYVVDDKYQSKTQQEMANFSQQEARVINSKVSSAATKGIGFLYEGYLKSKINAGPDECLLYWERDLCCWLQRVQTCKWQFYVCGATRVSSK